MKPEKFSGYWGSRQNMILLIITTVLIIYIAVPIYGVIQDSRQGETVFVIDGSTSGKGSDLLGKIIDFFFNSNKVEVPAVHIIDLKGTVLNSQNKPYSNGLIELRSTPRYTRTNEDGTFIFRAVETGKHQINVLDESGNIVAKCNVNITIDENTSNIATVSFSGSTYVINVSVNIETLVIKLKLETDEDGIVQGISSLEVTTPGQPEDSGTGNQTDSGEPDQQGGTTDGEPDQPGEEPKPPNTGGSGSSGGTGSGSGGASSNLFGVSDSDATSFGSAAAAQVNIFGEKHIAPGMKGSYRFSVDNTRNSYSSLYTVNFTNSDTLPAGSKIPMVFRLKAGNSYVAGDADWGTINQLYQDTVIVGKSKVVYTLEWYWPEGGNDNLYAELEKNEEYSYTLRIEVTAQQE